MSTYVFSEEWESERQRLAGLEGWLDPGTIRHLETIGVAEGWRCLEVGGGGGSIAQWLCVCTGETGRVVATDLDTRFLQRLSEPTLEVRTHDIANDPLEEDTFDLAHARCLLEHLPGRDDALKRMIASLRPGGWVLVEDFDMVTWIAVEDFPEYDRVRDGMLAVMESVGFDPAYGRRLPSVLIDAGLEDVDAEGRCVVGPQGPNPALDMFELTLSRLRDPILATGIASEPDLGRVLGRVKRRDLRALPPTIFAAWGRKPG